MKYIIVFFYAVLFSGIITSIIIYLNTKKQKATGKSAFEMKNTKGHRIATFILFLILGYFYFLTK